MEIDEPEIKKEEKEKEDKEKEDKKIEDNEKDDKEKDDKGIEHKEQEENKEKEEKVENAKEEKEEITKEEKEEIAKEEKEEIAKEEKKEIAKEVKEDQIIKELKEEIPKEEKEISLIQENSKIIKEAQNVIEDDSTSELKEIFIYKQSDKKINFLPILNNSKNLYKRLISIFSKPNKEIKQEILSYKNFILKRINLFNKIFEIIGNSYEIMHIIINFLKKNNIYPIKDIIDIYIDLISSRILDKDNEKNEYILDIKNILNWFLSSGFLNKNHTDYIFQQLAKFQTEKKLTPKLFDDYLELIELIYGKDFQMSLKRKLIAKNYIYFYDKENSIIRTNISKMNYIHIKDSCYIILWFYLDSNIEIKQSNFLLRDIWKSFP